MLSNQNTKKPGRPKGRQHDVTIHVRLPGPALEALKELAAREKFTVSQIVRAGIDAKLATLVAPCVKVARDESAAPEKRIRAAQTIHLIAVAGAYLGRMGLELARARAAREDADRANGPGTAAP